MRFKDPLLHVSGQEGVWFAWRPVTTREGYVVWFEKVRRTWVDQIGWDYEVLTKEAPNE